MERGHTKAMPEGNPRTLAEMEVWAVALHDMGMYCRLPIGERETMTIRRDGYEYHLIEGDYDRKSHGIPLPNFMGYEGFALRSITKL